MASLQEMSTEDLLRLRDEARAQEASAPPPDLSSMSTEELIAERDKAREREQRGSIVDPLMQGLVPFADEIAGGLAGATDWMRGNVLGEEGRTFSGGYNRIRNHVNADYDAFKERNPKTAMAAEIAGAIPTAVLPIGTVARGANVFNKALRGGMTGAGYGAVYGAGQGEGLDRAENAVKGAAAGGVFGGAAPFVARGVGKAVDGLRSVTGRQPFSRKAGNIILDDLAAEGTTVAQAGKQARGYGKQGMLADASPTLRLRAEQIAQSDNAARGPVIKALQSRSGGAEQRIGTAYDSALGQKPDVFQVLDDIKTTRRANAQPLYEKAYQQPVHFTHRLEFFTKTPSGKKALKRAEGLAADEGIDFQQIFARLDDSGNVISAERVPDTRGWDYVKRALDDMIEGAQKTDGFGRTTATNESRILTKLKNDILDEVDQANPLFKQARQQYSDDLSIEKAFGQGVDIFKSKTHPDFFARDVSKMSAAEQDALKLGVRAAVDEAMGRVRNGSLKGRQLLDADWNERKIISILGQKEGRQLIQALDAEQAMAETANQALGNSATARRLDNPFGSRGTGMTPEKKGVLRNILNFSFGDAAKAAGDKIERAFSRRGASNLASELGPILTAQGKTRDKIVSALRAFDQAKAQGRDSEAIEALVNAWSGTAGRAAAPRVPEITVRPRGFNGEAGIAVPSAPAVPVRRRLPVTTP